VIKKLIDFHSVGNSLSVNIVAFIVQLQCTILSVSIICLSHHDIKSEQTHISSDFFHCLVKGLILVFRLDA